MSGFDLNVPALVASGFTLTAALAWNEAAKGVVRSVYPSHQKNQTVGLIVYAIIVTILVVIIFAAMRAFQKRTEAKQPRGIYGSVRPSSLNPYISAIGPANPPETINLDTWASAKPGDGRNPSASASSGGILICLSGRRPGECGVCNDAQSAASSD